MAKNTRAGQFSPVSLEAATIVAKKWQKPRMLAAYLALARQTSMNDEGGYGPNMVTGAGANKVSEVIGCQWERAKQYVEALADTGVILKAPATLRAGHVPATWIMAHKGDTNLPHAAVDGLAGKSAGDTDKETKGKASSAIRRILDSKESDQVQLCALMLLLHCYHNHDLVKWGGINHGLIHRKWKTDVVTPAGQSFRWTVEPEGNHTAWAKWDLITPVLASIGVSLDGMSKDEMNKISQSLFWKAWDILVDTRLVYETVMILKKEEKELPKATPRAKPKFETVEHCIVPLRINDAHEDRLALHSWIVPTGEHGFYTNKVNPFEKPEGCWFLWPWKREDGFSVKGVWSLRFRCSTPETAVGIEHWQEVVRLAHQKLIDQGTLEDMTPAF
jgi:hypothetical protein